MPSIVQFFHPGLEHGYDVQLKNKKYFKKWNKGNHKRKIVFFVFVCLLGITSCDEKVEQEQESGGTIAIKNVGNSLIYIRVTDINNSILLNQVSIGSNNTYSYKVYIDGYYKIIQGSYGNLSGWTYVLKETVYVDKGKTVNVSVR